MSLLTYCMNILMSLMMLSMVFVMITMSAASAERVTEVINENSRSCRSGESGIWKWQMEVLYLTMWISVIRRNSKEPVLKDINLSIRAGETIGIIGGTGSAKSSLVNLISRLYDVSSWFCEGRRSRCPGVSYGQPSKSGGSCASEECTVFRYNSGESALGKQRGI